jgi:hypothetical protein
MSMKRYAIPQYKQVVTPPNPDATFNKLYFKSDDLLYSLNSSWNEIQIWWLVWTKEVDETDLWDEKVLVYKVWSWKYELEPYASWAWSWDVVWPSWATDNAIARYDWITGKLIQNSLVTIDDWWNINTPWNITANNISWTNTWDVVLAGPESYLISWWWQIIIVNPINLNSTNVSSVLQYDNWWTWLSTLWTPLQQLRVNAWWTALEYFTASTTEFSEYIYWDGSDWDLNVLSWTTYLNTNQLYQYDNINIAAWAKLSTNDVSWFLQLKCKWTCTINWEIDLSNKSTYRSANEELDSFIWWETVINWSSWNWWGGWNWWSTIWYWSNSWNPWWTWWLWALWYWWWGWWWIVWSVFHFWTSPWATYINITWWWWDWWDWWNPAWVWWAWNWTYFDWADFIIVNSWDWWSSSWWAWGWVNQIWWDWWDAYSGSWLVWDTTPIWSWNYWGSWWAWWAWWERWWSWLGVLLYAKDLSWVWVINTSWTSWTNWWNWSDAIVDNQTNMVMWCWGWWWGWWGWWGWSWGILIVYHSWTNSISYNQSIWVWWSWWAWWTKVEEENTTDQTLTPYVWTAYNWNNWLDWDNWTQWSLKVIQDVTII